MPAVHKVIALSIYLNPLLAFRVCNELTIPVLKRPSLFLYRIFIGKHFTKVTGYLRITSTGFHFDISSII
jgi:hypothetical protein